MGRLDRDEVLVRQDDLVERADISCANGTGSPLPSRSVRPTAPTSSEPPVNRGSARRPALCRPGVRDVLGRVAGVSSA